METPAPVNPGNPVEAPTTTAELEREVRAQQFLMRALMVVLTILLVTSTLALFHQIRWLVAQANQLNATAQELARGVGDYETNLAPQMGRLFDDLQRFAAVNADFARIFGRYQITNVSPVRPQVPSPAAGAGR